MPRQHGIPRRGSNTGSRGGLGGRGSTVPHHIPPIAIAAPSSLPSNNSEPTLNSSLHTARFKFKSKLNRPLISAIVTVIFSEEEDESTSSDEMPKDQSPSQCSNDSQSSLVGAFLNVSASGHEASHQQEIHTQPASEDIVAKNYIEEVRQETTQGQEMPQHQSNMMQEEIIVREPAQWEGGILNLVTTLDGEPFYDENGFVTWEASTSYTEGDKKDEMKSA